MDTCLSFLQQFFKKCNLQMLLLDPSAPLPFEMDLELRLHLGQKDAYTHFQAALSRLLKPCTIFKFTDQYLCNYLFLLADIDGKPTLISIGPYLPEIPDTKTVDLLTERFSLPEMLLQRYYVSLPVLPDSSPIFPALDTYCEHLWADSQISLVNLNLELSGTDLPHKAVDALDVETFKAYTRNIELVYAYETELMDVVRRGLTHKAELIRPSRFISFIEKRSPDPVRNLKNYCIIMHTLLRKAAQDGGVHPVHLDSTGTSFAKRIEDIHSLLSGQSLMDDMFITYCRLVEKFSTQNLSPLIRRTVIYIESNLGGNLSVAALADILNVNASYLSTQFKKELNTTLSEFIGEKRITKAVGLLSTSDLQIQVVAQRCGIPDVNYFCKKFKKATGQTPREFRNTVHSNVSM